MDNNIINNVLTKILEQTLSNRGINLKVKQIISDKIVKLSNDRIYLIESLLDLPMNNINIKGGDNGDKL